MHINRFDYKDNSFVTFLKENVRVLPIFKCHFEYLSPDLVGYSFHWAYIICVNNPFMYEFTVLGLQMLNFLSGRLLS